MGLFRSHGRRAKSTVDINTSINPLEMDSFVDVYAVKDYKSVSSKLPVMALASIKIT